MAHHLSQAATIDTLVPRRPSAPVCSTKRNNHDNLNTTSGTCCSGGGHHGCGCGCKSCVCRILLYFKDKSNRQAYKGQGGRQGMPNPDYDLPGLASRFDSSSSSIGTNDSRFLSNGSLDNSYEVPGQLNGHHPANIDTPETRHGYAASEEEEDGHYAWRNFTSPADSLDHMSFEEDSFIPGLMDDSTHAVRGSSIDIEERSILISEYEQSFASPSVTASEIINGTGAAFEDHFLVRPLRLTPECRHSLNRPICPRCMH